MFVKGHRHSEETKLLIKRNTPVIYGRTLSPEAKLRDSIAHLGVKNARFGEKVSLERRIYFRELLSGSKETRQFQHISDSYAKAAERYAGIRDALKKG